MEDVSLVCAENTRQDNEVNKVMGLSGQAKPPRWVSSCHSTRLQPDLTALKLIRMEVYVRNLNILFSCPGRGRYRDEGVSLAGDGRCQINQRVSRSDLSVLITTGSPRVSVGHKKIIVTVKNNQ